MVQLAGESFMSQHDGDTMLRATPILPRMSANLFNII